MQLHGIPLRAAELLRPAGGAPALLIQDLLPAYVVLGLNRSAVANLLADVGRKSLAQECADLLAKSLLFRGEIQIHRDRKSTRLNSSHVKISYAVFCLNKKTI